MNIERLVLRNFMAIGQATIDLSNRGLLLISGENKDETSANSNGAGKSSVPDGLCWVITGNTARGLSGDGVINNVAKKDCFGSVEMREGDWSYTITRTRKPLVGKNALTVVQQNLLTGAKTDLSKGTDAETQKVIDRAIGCSIDVFMSSVYCAQDCMPNLPAMTDKNLKIIVEEAAGTEALTEAYSVASKRLNAAVAQAGETTRSLATFNTARSRQEAELEEQKRQQSAFEEGREPRAALILKAGEQVILDIAKHEEAIADYDEPAILDLLKQADAKIDSLKAEQVEMERLRIESVTADAAAGRLRVTAMSLKDNLAAATVKLNEIANLVGKPCGECGKEYHVEDLETAREAQRKAIDVIKGEFISVATMLKRLMAEAATAADVAAKFKAGMTDVTALAKRRSALMLDVSAITGHRSDIKLLKEKADSVCAAANVKRSETNPWTKAVESKAAEVALTKERIAALTETLEDREAEVAVLTDVVKVFCPAGVRAHILDTVTPYLNDRTQKYLGVLSDGNISATWNTLSKTAKGELREKFSIEAINNTGAGSFVGLSGGEKRKVRLATAMALQDMIATRASKSINLVMLDEIDGMIDVSGLERLMVLLEDKGKEKGTVLIISHNDLADWCSNIISVTKEGGYSTLSGANENVI